ncbi:hypothetical protein CANMA_002662 [Candida margitis]|uniref:uncharacterized protein n=1 Tax=Candida margitis TaxID=1775924 RepID=UPI002226319C|nr:uncharacterized protein CANMA_002662 [Candida margitis]KAI5967894.1 hypothetical protein CANMA_002662 [Candida margitis]
MFSIFDASSFTDVNRKLTPPETPIRTSTTNTTQVDDSNALIIGFEQKQIKTHNIVGARFRSKTGCLNCRKRKKKCDETSPVCQACQVRNQKCVWPDLSKKTNSRVSKPGASTIKQRSPPMRLSSSDSNSSSTESVSSGRTQSGSSSLRTSPATKSTSPSSSSLSLYRAARPSRKYDNTLLSFDPAHMTPALPISSTRNDTETKNVTENEDKSSSHVVTGLSVLTGIVDFDNDVEEAMDDVGHLNMNVLFT